MLTPLYPIANAPATITVAAPGASVDDESIPVDALTTALPIGFILDFGDGKFAKLATAAEVDDEALDVEPIPTAIDEGDTATISGNATAYGVLSEAVRALDSADRIALNIAAELVLDLRAPIYSGDDAEELAIAVAYQMNVQAEYDVGKAMLKSVSPASPGPTRTFRDRWIDPRAAAIVARVTGRQAVRFTPPTMAGV